jgi:hypothetical protein
LEIVKEAPAPARAFPVSLPALAWAAAAALAGWLLLPALTPAHLEGFTAALAALGLHLAQGSLADFDTLQPLNAEYYALTKLGAVLAVGALAGPLGSDLALRIVMWAGLGALLAGSAFLSRKWSGASWPFVLAPLVLLPGIFESGFLYNDNIPAAGLAALGLSCLYARRWPGLAAAGALIGLAVLTRTDTILACACVPVILYERFGATRRGAGALALVGATAAAALLGPLAWFGASILDVLAVGSAAVELWSRPTSGAKAAIMTLYFLGLAGLPLAAAGIFWLVRRGEYLPLVRLLSGPLLLLALLGDKMWEIRQLLVLAPFLCALAAIGLKAVYEDPDGGARKWLRPGVAAIALVSLAGPMTAPRLQDGPRVLTGRAWAIPLWRDWQEAPRRDLAMLDSAIHSGTVARPLVLIADEWNEDRYLHLKLLDAGYSPGSFALPEACGPVVERFGKGGSQVLLMRLHHAMIPYWREIKPERLERWGLPCLRGLNDPQVLFVATSAHARALLPGAEPAFGPGQDDPRRDPLVARLSYGPIVAVALPPGRQAELRAAFAREAAAIPRRGGRAPPSADAAVAASRKRTGFPGGH